MPTQAGDFMLAGKPYMLARGSNRGRAWRRQGLSNAARPRITDAESRRSALPPEVDFVAVYDDFSGGYGYGYRRPDRPNTVHWSENFDLRFPNQAIHAQEMRLAALGGVPAMAQQVEYLYDVPPPVAAGTLPLGGGAVLAIGKEFIGRYVTNGALDVLSGPVVATLELSLPGDTAAGRPAIAGSFTYIGLKAQGGPFYRRTHNATYTAGPANLPGRGFINSGTRIWRKHGPSADQDIYLQNGAYGSDLTLTNAWSATLPIGNGFNSITDMIALNDQVFLGMPDGLHAGDISGTFYNVLPEVADRPHPDNGRDLAIFENGILYPHQAGVYWYRPSSETAISLEVGPSLSTANRGPVRGRIRCVQPYGPWVFGGMYNGSQSYVMGALNASPGLPYVWSVMQRLPHSSKISRIHIDGITTPSAGTPELTPRMWVATDGSLPGGVGTAPLYVFPIPYGHDNPLSNTAFTAHYVGSARMDLGRDDRSAPNTLKVLRKVDVITDAGTMQSGAIYADVYYRIDGGPRTLLGRAQTSPRSTLYFSSGEGSFVTCYDFELSIDSFLALTTADFRTQMSCPVYRSFEVHGAFLSEGADQIVAIVRTADNMRDRYGALMPPGAVQLADLRALGGRGPVRLSDLTGAQHWVTVDRQIAEEEVYQEEDDTPEIVATLRMVVQQFS